MYDTCQEVVLWKVSAHEEGTEPCLLSTYYVFTFFSFSL